MPQYKYIATNEKSKTVHGVAKAVSPEALYAQLRTEGLYMTEQTEVTEGKSTGRALKTAVVAEFCRSLGTLLTAGVPLVRAFAIMEEEDGITAATKRLYSDIRADLRKGTPLSDALQNQDPAFPVLLIGMVRSAEGTGSIDKALMRMATHYEKEHKLNQEVGNSLMYPAILGVLIVGVVVVLMTFVVPQFEDMFAEMETLPLPTAILLGMSDFLQQHWLLTILAVIFIVIIFICIGRIPAVRLQLDRFKLHAPIIGKLNRRICTARFARTLSNLYSGGLPIMAALSSARNTIGNTWISNQFDDVLAEVRAGHSMSGALAEIDGFERKLSSSIMVGEETGKLDDMLANMSETMDYEAEMATKRLMTLIEPVMIVLMAVIVAFVVIAIIMPIYLSYGSIGGSAAAI